MPNSRFKGRRLVHWFDERDKHPRLLFFHPPLRFVYGSSVRLSILFLFIAPDWLFKWFSYCTHDPLISITPHWVILYAMVIFMRLNWSRKVSKWSIFGVSSNTLCMQPSKRDKLITFVKDDLELTVDSLSGDPLTKVFRSKLNCKPLMCTHPNEYFVTLIIFEELFCR